MLSAFTGALLFIPRAAGAAANPTFRLKLALIVAADSGSLRRDAGGLRRAGRSLARRCARHWRNRSGALVRSGPCGVRIHPDRVADAEPPAFARANGVGTLVRESLYGFPILVGIHVWGWCCRSARSSGSTFVSWRRAPFGRRVARLSSVHSLGNLRLRCHVQSPGHCCSPASRAPRIRARSSASRCLALLLAAANALSTTWSPSAVARMGCSPRPPGAARRRDGLDVLWAIVIMCGRIMSYSVQSGDA